MWIGEFLQSIFSLFGFTLSEGLYILLIPFIVDYSRSLGKSIIVPCAKIYSSLKGRFQKKREPFLPMVSVIIPAHNEEKNIERTIETVLELSYPRMEVIVVDDCSNDETYKKALPFANKGDIKLFRRDTPSGSKALAIDYGLLFAKGEVVVTMDADTMLDRKSVDYLVRPLEDQKVAGVAGNIRVANNSNLWSRLQSYEYMFSMEMGRGIQSLFRTILIIPGAFGATRKDGLKGVGTFEADTITEDFDLSLKMHKIGRVVFSQKAVAWTVCPERIGDWIRQRKRWTRGQMDTIIKHKNIFFKRRFGVIGLFGAPDMFFMDILMLFLRFTYAIYTFSFYPLVILGQPVTLYYNYLARTLGLTITFYLFIEVLSLISALAITKHRDMKFFFYIPIMVLIYRPFYSLVRLSAYLDYLRGKEPQW